MNHPTSLRRSATIQLRVIHALVMREVITRYGRHNIGFLWLFLEPMLFTLGITTLWTVTKASHGSDLPIVAFAVTGYSSILLWRNTSNRCLKALEPNLNLLYHRNVTIGDVFFARVFLELVGATVSCAVLTVVFSLAGWMSFPANILTALQGWGLLCWFSLGLGLTVGALSEKGELIDRVWHIVTYLMFPLSGAAFLMEWMPTSFQEALRWVPMVHATEMIRHGYFGALIHPQYDAAYLARSNAVLTMVGLAMTRQLRENVQPA
jgi:capsular polysaccharide transport system permease protein